MLRAAPTFRVSQYYGEDEQDTQSSVPPDHADCSNPSRQLPLPPQSRTPQPASAGTVYTHWSHPSESTPSLATSAGSHATSYFSVHHSTSSLSHRSHPPPGGRVKYAYSYTVMVGTAPIQFIISVEPSPSRARQFTFLLSIKTIGVERTLCEPVFLNLAIDPSTLDFAVFVFPPKQSLPTGCLHSLRVWLRTNGVDHRIFAEDELWVGRDPDFNSLPDACYARLTGIGQDFQNYQGYTGGARVTYVMSWKRVGEGLFNYTLEYESGGAGASLFDDFSLRLECDPRSVTFLIYTIPTPSTPPGASHRLRIWLRAVSPLPSRASYNPTFAQESHIYQRIHSLDSFKLGASLDFGSMGRKFVMGFKDGTSPRTAPVTPSPLRPVTKATASRKEDVAM